MFFANIAKARRRAIVREENVFDEVEREHQRIAPQKVTPSFTREHRVNIGKSLKEKRKAAEREYQRSFAEDNTKREEQAHAKLQSALGREAKYKKFKKEKLDRQLSTVKSVFGVIGKVSKGIKERKARKGVFKGFGQQSQGFQGMDYSQSPFRK
jgi:hypothetical protein